MTGIFDVKSRRIPGAVVLSAVGEMDVATAPALVQEAMRLIARGHDRLIIELAGVTFLDSSGINGLVRVMKSATSRGGKVVVAAPARSVARVFELTGLERLIPVVGTLGAAVTALDRPVMVAEVLTRASDLNETADVDSA